MKIVKKIRLLAMDVSALASMKDAAYCEKQCDLQNSEKHLIFERIRYSLALLESMSSSVPHIFAISIGE
jgi:hypothetical protein